MSLSYFYILTSFLVSLFVGIVVIPVVVSFCKKKRLYDIPNERKVHKSFVPRLGGICFMPCMILSCMFAIAVFNNVSFSLKFNISLWACYFFIGLLCIYAVGVVDDIVGLKPKTKFVVQLFAATILPLSGLYINDFYGFCGIHAIPFYIGAPLTVFIIVFIDNAMNLIDGIDGLSSGLSVIALCGFLVSFLSVKMWVYGILVAGLMGVLLAFMYYNIYGEPGKNKIFMGDSGSLTIGFILGVLFVKLSMNNPNVSPFSREGLLLAYSLLIVPVYDVCRVIIVRLLHKKPIFIADKNHIHHKMLRAGLTQHQALCVILALALLFIAMNSFIAKFTTLNIIVLVDVIVWTAFHIGLDYFIRRNKKDVFHVEPLVADR